MARYCIDGITVYTTKAQNSWDDTRFSVVTETLYRSSSGRRGRRYYIVSQRQESTPHARWVDETEAAAWLSMCGYDPVAEELPASAVGMRRVQ